MSEASPERIYTRIGGADGEDGAWSGTFALNGSQIEIEEDQTEYVRADILAQRDAEVERLREALAEVLGLFDRDGYLFCSGEWQMQVVPRARAALSTPTETADDVLSTEYAWGEAADEAGAAGDVRRKTLEEAISVAVETARNVGKGWEESHDRGDADSGGATACEQVAIHLRRNLSALASQDKGER